jgi:hypothetical protein
MQAVHDRLDDLQYRERRDAVADQRAKDAPPLQLCDQGHGDNLITRALQIFGLRD